MGWQGKARQVRDGYSNNSHRLHHHQLPSLSSQVANMGGSTQSRARETLALKYTYIRTVQGMRENDAFGSRHTHF